MIPTKLKNMVEENETVKEPNTDVIRLALKVEEFEETLKGIIHLKNFKYLNEKLLALNENAENKKKIKSLERDVYWLTSVVNEMRSQKSEENTHPVIQRNTCEEEFNTAEVLYNHTENEHKN